MSQEPPTESAAPKDSLESFGEGLCGEALALLREKAGLTQVALGEKLKVDYRWICTWERASKRPPGPHRKAPPLTPARLLEIAGRLGYPVDEVLRVLQLLRDLHPGKAQPGYDDDPLAPTPMEERALNFQTLRFDSLMRRHFRKKKLELALAAADEKLQQLLSEIDHPARLYAIRNAREHQQWGLCLLCCNESIRAAADDPLRARELAELAVAVAETVKLRWKGRLRAYALAHLGNALRVAQRFDQAAVLFDEARMLWESSPKDPGILEPSRIYELEASLRRDQRLYPEALALLGRAEPISTNPGLVAHNRATVFEKMGLYTEALAALHHADKLLSVKEPRDVWMLCHSRGVNLAHLGRFAEAAVFSEKAMELAEELENRLDQTRSLWLQARVHAGRGEWQAAVAGFTIVIRELQGHRLTYDVALVSHELLVVFLEAGEQARARALASQLARYCKAYPVHEEALAAIRLFLDAIARRNASVDLGRKVVAFLYRAQHDESLRFAAQL